MVKAERIPALLKELRAAPLAAMYDQSSSDVSDLPEVVEQFLLDPKRHGEALWNRIQYQFSAYEPTGLVASLIARALPFAEDPDGILVEWLSRFTGLMTMTETQNLLVWVPEGHVNREAVEIQYEKEQTWVDAVQAACWESQPYLLEELNFGGLKNSLYGPFVLTQLIVSLSGAAPEDTDLDGFAWDLIVGFVEQCRTATDPVVQAGYLSGLMAVGEFYPEAWELDWTEFLNCAAPANYFAALALVGTEEAPQSVGGLLQTALVKRDEIDAELEGRFPWGHDPIRLTLIPAICDLPEDGFYASLAILLEIIRTEANAFTVQTDCIFPIWRALDGLMYDPEVPLSKSLAALIKAMCEREEVWAYHEYETGKSLAELGLPKDREALYALTQKTK